MLLRLEFLAQDLFNRPIEDLSKDEYKEVYNEVLKNELLARGYTEEQINANKEELNKISEKAANAHAKVKCRLENNCKRKGYAIIVDGDDGDDGDDGEEPYFPSSVFAIANDYSAEGVKKLQELNEENPLLFTAVVISLEYGPTLLTGGPVRKKVQNLIAEEIKSRAGASLGSMMGKYLAAYATNYKNGIFPDAATFMRQLPKTGNKHDDQLMGAIFLATILAEGSFPSIDSVIATITKANKYVGGVTRKAYTNNIHNVPTGYDVDLNAGIVTGPRGGKYIHTGIEQDGSAILKRENGSYFVVKDGKQVNVNSPYNFPPVKNPSADHIKAANNYGVAPKWLRFDEVEGKYVLRYPDNGGFATIPKTVTLQKGTTFSRYGGWFDSKGIFKDAGEYVSPTDVSFDQRSIPNSRKNDIYTEYVVIKEIPDVETGPAAPFYGKPGGGTQHKINNMRVEDLIKGGYIEVVKRTGK